MAQKRDLIERIVEQLAKAIAQIGGLRKAGALEEATAEIERTAGALAGINLEMVRSIGSASIAAMTPDPARLWVLAHLAAELSEVERCRNQPDRERDWQRRAVELWLEAALSGHVLDEVALSAIAAEPEEGLAPRYVEARARFARPG